MGDKPIQRIALHLMIQSLRRDARQTNRRVAIRYVIRETETQSGEQELVFLIRVPRTSSLMVERLEP